MLKCCSTSCNAPCGPTTESALRGPRRVDAQKPAVTQRLLRALVGSSLAQLGEVLEDSKHEKGGGQGGGRGRESSQVSERSPVTLTAGLLGTLGDHLRQDARDITATKNHVGAVTG